MSKHETIAVTRTKHDIKTNTWMYWQSYGNDWTPFSIQRIYTNTIENKELGFRFYLN